MIRAKIKAMLYKLFSNFSAVFRLFRYILAGDEATFGRIFNCDFPGF